MRSERLRLLLLCVLIGLIAVAVGLLVGTQTGRTLVANPHALGEDVRRWVAEHAVAAPVAYVGLYVALSVLALPVWWLLILGGYGFGLAAGIVWSDIGATLGATLTVALARWMGGTWFHQRIETRLERLRRLDEAMGHHGLLVVVALRLTHIVPFGVANYLLGLSKVSVVDVAVGTALGTLPIIGIYVTLGADHGHFAHWRLAVILGVTNLALVVPLVVRYWRPAWARRVGIE